MKSVVKKAVCFITAITMLSTVYTGCSKNDTNHSTASSPALEKDLWAGAEDSSDLPDWKGKQLKLKYWDAYGTGNSNRNKKATKDVVTDEAFRVTGVKIDPESAFDNGGQNNMEVKLGMLSAANDYPQIISGGDMSQISKMASAGLLYDLTDLIPKYMPNLMKNVSKEMFQDIWNGYCPPINGKQYNIPYSVSNGGVQRFFTEKDYADPNLYWTNGGGKSSEAGWIYVRDDILKKIYPNVMTQAELEQKFVNNNGKYEEKDFYDVQINNVEEFVDFLRKIKQLGLKEDNKDVYPIWSHNGGDNWLSLTLLSGVLYGYNMNSGLNNNYFTYWDKKTQQIEYAFKQPWFKDILKMWNGLVKEGLSDPESIVDNKAAFDQKLNNGLFAVTWAYVRPSKATLEKSGKTYQYRKVYLHMKPNYDRFAFPSMLFSNSGIVIVKPTVDKNDLPQILRWLDYYQSDAGLKTSVWGPRSAGLFKEENGQRRYTDPLLEKCMVYDEKNERNVYYGISTSLSGIGPFPGNPTNPLNRFHPKYTYTIPVDVKQADSLYSYSKNVAALKEVQTKPWTIIDFSASGLKVAQQALDGRTAFENSLKKVFVASNDEQFEKLYQEMLKVAETIGLTEDNRKIYDKDFKERNKEFMNNLK